MEKRERDVEARKAAVEKGQSLRASGMIDEALWGLVDQSVFVLDRDTSILCMNEQAVATTEAIWGQRPENGDLMAWYSAPDLLQAFLDKLARAFEGQKVVDTREVTYPSGLSVWYTVQYLPLKIDDKIEAVVFAATDVSRLTMESRERHAFERALNRLSSGVTIASADPTTDYELTFVNDGFCRVTGYERHEILGRNCRWLQEGVEVDQEAELRKMRDILISQSSGSVVLHNRKKDGTIFINRIDLSPVFDESGKLAEYIGLQTDITEEVNLRNGMARAQRMESLGQLAAGMAHDFNNSLQIILNSAQLSLLELEEGSDTREDLSTIEQAAQHASKLVADLLTFARAKTTEQTEFDLVEKLESMSGMMRALMSGRGSLALSMPTAPVTVIGDPRQVEQVVLNLVSNARDAIAADGHVEVSVEFEGPYYDHKAVIRVSDDGSGMTRELQERAFEPFFSSKGEAGTGLGLATSFGIITGMGGTIDIESAPGEGTTVICRLPLASTSEQPARV